MDRLQKQRLQDFVSNEISEDDLCLLLDDVDQSPELRQELVAVLHTQGLLTATLTSTDDLEHLRSAVRTALKSTPDASAFRRGVMDQVRGKTDDNPPAPKAPRKLPVWWLAAAAAIAIAASLLWQPERAATVAKVASTGGGFDLDRGGRIVSMYSGMQLRDRDVLRGNAATEKLVLVYDDGTEATISGAGELSLRQVDGAKHVHQNYGKITLDVVPQPSGKPLLVTTPHARAKVIGTTLTVTTDDRATQLDVSSGTVLFENLLEDQALVEAGHSAVAIVGERRLRKMIPDLSASPDDRERFGKWKQWAAEFAKDPQVVAYYDFEEEDHKTGRLSNKATNFGNDGLHVRNVDGRIRTCSWTRGRFAGLKQALLFQDLGFVDLSNDHSLRLNEPPLGVFAWFKVSSFTAERQPILTHGDYSWRLERYEDTDRIGFFCHGLQQSNFVVTESTVNDEQWHLIVATYDGERLSIYLDGVLESSAPASGPLRRKSGVAGTHVLLGANSDAPHRDFQGWIDEVGIFQRTMTAEEVREMWELGK